MIFFFSLLISMPRVLKALVFIKIGLKLSYFCKKKIQNFRALGAPAMIFTVTGYVYAGA